MNTAIARAWTVWASLALCVTACSSTYDVTLTVTDDVNRACNTSCVRSVLMVALGENADAVQCVHDVSMKSLKEHGLSGAFDQAAPDGLGGVLIGGYRGADCDDLLVFDGIGPVSGSSVKVAAECVASCSDLTTITTKTTNIIAAMQGRCEVGSATAVSAGVLRSDRVDRVSPLTPYTLFTGGPPVTLATGVAQVPGATLSVGRDRACAAAAVFTGSTPTTVACIRGYKGLCLDPVADAGKIEVATYAAQYSVVNNDKPRTVAVFAQRDLATGLPKPLEGATVALDPLSPPAEIEYNDLVIEGGVPVLRVRATQSTGPSGAFSVHAREPVSVTISHGGKQYRRLISGGLVINAVNDVFVGGAQIITPE